MKLVKLLLALVFLTAAQPSPATELLAPGRTVVINGVIERGNIMSLVPDMNRMVARSKAPIHMIINSPGGDVITGFLFINHMEAVRAKGVEIYCYVPEVAASMAFQIYLHCDKRFALSKSFLLWHGARVQIGGMGGTAMTEQSASQLSKELESINKVIIDELKANIDMPEIELMAHFYAETLHIASNLKALAPDFLTVETSIPGLLDALKNDHLPRVGDGLNEFSNFEPGEIVYIKSDVK